jgi:hypothetical protein
MMDAAAAFREAVSSFRKTPVDYALYSLVFNVCAGILFTALLATALVLSVLGLGGSVALFAAGSNFIVSLAGLAFMLLVVALGLVVFLWLSSGLTGAYMDTLSGLLSGRNVGLAGFFKGIPRRATQITLLAILVSLCVAVPVALAAVALSMALGSVPLLPIILVLLAFVLAMLAGFLFMFALPAIVVDGKRPVAAIKASVLLVVRNPVAAILYVLISAVAGLPVAIPIIGAVYGALFYLPLTWSALLSMYKRAK